MRDIDELLWKSIAIFRFMTMILITNRRSFIFNVLRRICDDYSAISNTLGAYNVIIYQCP